MTQEIGEILRREGGMAEPGSWKGNATGLWLFLQT
jgi:hypothetical protein